MSDSALLRCYDDGARPVFSVKRAPILLHSGELQARVGCEFEPIDARLHEAADGVLSQARRAGVEEV